MVQGGEGQPQPQPDSVGLGRYFLLNHVGLSHLIYGLMLATSSSSPTTCWPEPSVLSCLSSLYCVFMEPPSVHCTYTVFLFLMSSPQSDLDSFPRTSRYQHRSSTTITSCFGRAWRHSLYSLELCQSPNNQISMVVVVAVVAYLILILFLLSPFPLLSTPSQVVPKQQGPFDVVTAGAGGSTETRPGQSPRARAQLFLH